MITDSLVVGAGIAGAAAAYELAASRRVILLEAEPAPGYHSTGRSAALFTPNYGNAVVCALVAAGRSFFEAPPPGFAAQPLLAARGALTIAGPGQRQALGALMAEDGIVEIEPERALELVPILRPEAVAHAAYEPNVMDMDVHAIHQGFLRGLTARGGRLLCDSRVTAAARRGNCWTVLAGGRRFEAPVLVNAAGAWADEVAALAGVAPIGLTPKRRTAAIVDAPDGTAPEG